MGDVLGDLYRAPDLQAAGELSTRRSVNDMVKLYALCERALIYDWCLSGGGYSLRQYGQTMMPMFFQGFRAKAGQ